jgi:selenocysteine lyase/cysteine desulfurase
LSTGIDVARVRAATPGCERVVHLNNAGAALLPQSVLDTVVAHLVHEADIGGYEAAEAAADRIEAVYRSVATLLGARVDEIALVESATRAWTTYFSARRFEPGQRILTHRVEYASNFIPMLQAARRDGVRIEVVPSTAFGEIDVDALRSMIDDRVALVALTHVPSQGGLVNPAAAVGAVTRAAGVPFVLDACQSAGQLPLDVDTIGCDVLVATGRKFLRGPRGTGFLYVRRAHQDGLEPEAPDLRGAEWTGARSYVVRDDARRFEQWERSVANVLGLGTAVELVAELGIDAIAERVTALGAELRAALATVDGVVLRDEGREQCGIVTFTLEGHDVDAVKHALRAQQVNVWTIDATTAQLDFGARGLPAVVRASVHYYNTSEDLEKATTALRAV